MKCKKKIKDSKGITIIALVITIIVLLILAGITIVMLTGDNGILTKTTEAKKKSTEATAKEKVQTEVMASYGTDGKIDIEQLNKNLQNISGIKYNEKTISEENKIVRLPAIVELEGYEVLIDANGKEEKGKTLEEAKSNEMLKSTNNIDIILSDGTVILPSGFKVAEDSGNSVSEGIVIEDSEQNQFVWIPVDNIENYQRKTYYPNASTGEKEANTNSEKINYNSSTDYYFYEALPDIEMESININRGFYVGRYEAGDKESTIAKNLRGSNSSTKNTITIKKGQIPYNYINQSDAKKLAEEFGTKHGYKATTKLLSSYAWDTVITFIESKSSNNNYGNSSPEGNYKNAVDFNYIDINGTKQQKTKGISTIIPTGQTKPICNIYDIGGNVWEWTTESCSSDGYNWTKRGGSFNGSFSGSPAGRRDNRANEAGDIVGFRLAIFL